MPRAARLVVPGIPHHVTQRGNCRQRTFFSDDDYRLYVKHLHRECRTAGTSVWAWCLMPNHVHLVLVPADAAGLRTAVGRAHWHHSSHINAREDWSGHLWQSRFASVPMDEAHLHACVRYVELNPVRAGLVTRAEEWPWSSARGHLGAAVDPLIDPQPMRERIPDWRAYLDLGLDAAERDAIRASEKSGRPLGGPSFLERLAAISGRKLRPARRGRPKKREKA